MVEDSDQVGFQASLLRSGDEGLEVIHADVLARKSFDDHFAKMSQDEADNLYVWKYQVVSGLDCED